MPTTSAGLLLYRQSSAGALDVFLVHPGGPFWVKKDAAAWSIPKGEFSPDEDPLAAAQREFTEETGFRATGPFLPLGEFKLAGGKRLHVWSAAAPADLDPAAVVSNTFRLEWPPRSGRFAEFPEVDRAAWFPLPVAAEKLHRGQLPLLSALQQALAT